MLDLIVDRGDSDRYNIDSDDIDSLTHRSGAEVERLSDGAHRQRSLYEIIGVDRVILYCMRRQLIWYFGGDSMRR